MLPASDLEAIETNRYNPAYLSSLHIIFTTYRTKLFLNNHKSPHSDFVKPDARHKTKQGCFVDKKDQQTKNEVFNIDKLLQPIKNVSEVRHVAKLDERKAQNNFILAELACPRIF